MLVYMLNKFLKYIIPLFIFMPIIIVCIGIGVAYSELWGPLPEFSQLENPETNLATEVLSTDKKVIGKYFIENRTHVAYEDLSIHLINALVSTEDERFFNHSGIDFIALIRAIKGVVTNNSLGGGSTITQQLAKMFFSKQPKSKIDRVKQKFKEWVIALKIERQYSKPEIIAMYLNRFDFLNLAVGIKSASKIYFNTEPINLSVEEAAVLIGMAKNPSLYNPLRRLEKTRKRRNIVLNQMVKNNHLSIVKRDSLAILPIELNYKKADHNEGLATYFREHLRAFMGDWIKKRELDTGDKYNLYTDGLKIYTTIDSRMQEQAEIAVKSHIKEQQEKFYSHWKGFAKAPFDTTLRFGEIDTIILMSWNRSERYRKLIIRESDTTKIKSVFNKAVNMSLFSWDGPIDTILSPKDSIKYYSYFLHSSLISIEPQNGHIKAWVGGINHKQFKYDHVKIGKRQVGSTFKPFLYATAIDQFKYSPCMKVPNVQVIFEKEKWGLEEDYIPSNANKKYGGEYSLIDGLAKSKNTISAFLMKRVGPKKVISLARRMGIKSYLPAYPSLCLGTAELSLFEMTSAYTTFANEGMHVESSFILRIEDKNGIVLESFNYSPREVLSEEKNYIMVKLMQGVIENGSGRGLKWRYDLHNEIGGKTGTTQNQSDGWFIGFVPNLVTGVWTGADNRAVHFRDLNSGQGARTALPIWGNYMNNLYSNNDLNISKEPFPFPENGVSVSLKCDEVQNIFNNDEEF